MTPLPPASGPRVSSRNPSYLRDLFLLRIRIPDNCSFSKKFSCLLRETVVSLAIQRSTRESHFVSSFLDLSKDLFPTKQFLGRCPSRTFLRFFLYGREGAHRFFGHLFDLFSVICCPLMRGQLPPRARSVSQPIGITIWVISPMADVHSTNDNKLRSVSLS